MITTALVSPTSISAGSLERKYSSGENNSVLVSQDRNCRIDSMFEADQHADEEPGERADHADRSAGDQEHPHDRALRGAHGAQDRDIAALVLHQHDQAGDDVQRRDQDDQGQDQEHHVALDLQRIEERRIALPPVDQEYRPPAASVTDLRKASILSGLVVKTSIEVTSRVAVEIGLRFGQRHEHEASSRIPTCRSRTPRRPCRV